MNFGYKLFIGMAPCWNEPNFCCAFRIYPKPCWPDEVVEMVSVTARKKRKSASFSASRPTRWLPVGINISASTIAIGVVVVMVLLCYANALRNDFVFDDNAQV